MQHSHSMKELNTLEIKAAFSKDPTFIGVYPINRLPTSVDQHSKEVIKMIANLDPSNLPGTHWVAFLILGGKGFYFDSFADFPPSEAQQWLSRNCSNGWDWNQIPAQSPTNKVLCGHLCVSFLKNF